ncbi:MAG: rRNA maturation RNase YbeY [Rhodobacteraceae bacterium]|nr:rRNA maturation RNase YbeY [Paracoccaceae bacterium]|tara:strand:+ start:355 stop:855 length:501 start_codon:yes stop_codon:yes gene_type:complete
MGISIYINFQEKKWIDRRLKVLAQQAFDATIMSISCKSTSEKKEISILACNDQTIKKLNHQFRGKNISTNVLSWPRIDHLASKNYQLKKLTEGTFDLGDIAISYETCINQAENLGIRFENHVIHLLIHAFLHLLGYSHQKESDFETMKDLEIKSLGLCKIENPYQI